MSALLDNPVGHPVATAITEIEAVLADITDRPLWSMTDAELSGVTVSAGRLVRRVQALLVRLVGEVDSREIGCRTGASTTAGWVRQELTVGVRESRQLVAVARATRTTLSATGQALADGRFGMAHAGAIVRAVQALPAGLDPDIAARAEADLIEAAARFDPEQLARLGAHILQVVAPEIGDAIEAKRLAEQEQRAAQRREFTITPDGHGLEWLRGKLDTESAAILKAALVELARRSLAAGDLPDIGGERPHVTITLPLAALLAGVGAATLDDGGRLSPAAARRIACDSRLIPAVLGGPSEVLDLGRTQRFFTGAPRRALVLRDRGCAFPGCDRPPACATATTSCPSPTAA